MPKYYRVNIEKCNPEDIGPIFSVGEFIAMEGQYCEKYDVIEELLPPGICNAHRFETKWAKDNLKYWGPDSEEEIDFLPLGFTHIPIGAVITEIEE